MAHPVGPGGRRSRRLGQDRGRQDEQHRKGENGAPQGGERLDHAPFHTRAATQTRRRMLMLTLASAHAQPEMPIHADA